jgi:hypothetical protein
MGVWSGPQFLEAQFFFSWPYIGLADSREPIRRTHAVMRPKQKEVLLCRRRSISLATRGRQKAENLF